MKLMYTEKKYNPDNGLWYCKNGDYWVPMIAIPESEANPNLQEFGLMRYNYLEEYLPLKYEAKLIMGNLFKHCKEVEAQAEKMLQELMVTLPKEAGATEELKRQDMMKWVGIMENCHQRAMEIIQTELIRVP